MNKDETILESDEQWVSETEPIIMRDDEYYFFHRGWNEVGPFEDLDSCRMSLEAYLDTSEYI